MRRGSAPNVLTCLPAKSVHGASGPLRIRPLNSARTLAGLRPADGAGAADVRSDGGGQALEVVLGQDRSQGVRPGERVLHLLVPLRVEAERPAQQERVRRDQQQEDVDHGAGARDVPRGQDRDLRDHRGDRRQQPPADHAPEGREQGGDQQEDGRGEPQQAQSGGLLEGGVVGPSESLSRHQEVDQAVDGHQRHDGPAKEIRHRDPSLLPLCSSRGSPATGRAPCTSRAGATTIDSGREEGP